MWTPQQPTPSSRLFSPSSSSSTYRSKAWSASPNWMIQNCSSSCLDLATHGDTEAAAIADLGYFARDELAWWWPWRWWWGWGWWTMVMMTRNWPVKVVFMIIWGQVASKCKNANKGGRAWSENQGTGEGIDETFEDALLRNYTVGKLQDVRLQIWLIFIWVVSVLSFVNGQLCQLCHLLKGTLCQLCHLFKGELCWALPVVCQLCQLCHLWLFYSVMLSF